MKYLSRSLLTLPLYLGLCRDEAAFQKEMKRLKVPRESWPPFIPDGKDACAHFFERGSDVNVVICLARRKRPKAQLHALLVHEAVHVWQEVRRILGEKEPSSEFEAYAVQSISQTLFEAL